MRVAGRHSSRVSRVRTAVVRVQHRVKSRESRESKVKRRRKRSENEKLAKVERDEHMLTAHARLWRRTLSRAYSAIAMENPVLEAPVHRGMQQLDRSAFKQQLTLLAARLPATKTTQFMHKDAKESVWTPVVARESRCWVRKLTPTLVFFTRHSFVLRLRGIGPVNPDPSEQHRRVLLRTGDRCTSSLPG